MNPDLSEKAINKIEALCKQGCSQVNQVLDDAKHGKVIDGFSDFSDKEINQIIDELAQIMSVYNKDHPL